MKRPVILRKRLIPYETVDLRDDELIYRDVSLLITRWRPIKPRPDVAGGVSFYFLERGRKLSRFYAAGGAFLYWYCDIVDTEYIEESDTYVFTDLLLDVRLDPDGGLAVLDEDEFERACAEGLVTAGQRAFALKTLRGLLSDIAAGVFPPAICADPRYAWVPE